MSNQGEVIMKQAVLDGGISDQREITMGGVTDQREQEIGGYSHSYNGHPALGGGCNGGYTNI